MSSSTIRRTLGTALTGAALAAAAGAPAAFAMPADPARMPPAGDVREVIVPAPSISTESAAPGGFDVGAAGIGAAGTGLVVLLVAGGLAWQRPATRRHRRVAAGG